MHIKKFLDHSPKKVVLVCMGPSCTDWLTETLTQEFDPHARDEVWTINMASNCFHHDVVFWLDDLLEQQKFKSNLMLALKLRGKPVITSKRYEDIVPLSYDFPIEDVGAIGIPVFGKPYLNNGVAMAVAYALHKGVKQMTIFGADFSYPNRDYAESGRACVESWITLAGTRGMEIRLSPSTSLMDAVKDGGVYGYTDQPAIPLPNGQIFQYVKKADIGRYLPENSSGDKNATTKTAPGNGNAGGEQAGVDATPAPTRSGEGLWDSSGPPGDKSPDVAGLEAGGGNGGIPASPQK